jgi:predicted DNA-binding transcriptional regulator AlpA
MTDLLNAEAVAAKLGVSVGWVKRHTRESVAGEERIPSIRLGKVFRYHPNDVEKWIEKRAAK